MCKIPPREVWAKAFFGRETTSLDLLTLEETVTASMRKILLEMSKTFVWHRGLSLIFPWRTRMHCHWWTRWSWRLCWVVLQHQDELGGSSWSTSWARPPPWNINITVLVLLIIVKFSSLLSLSPSSTVDGGLTPFVSGKKSTRPAAAWWSSTTMTMTKMLAMTMLIATSRPLWF